MLGADCLNEMNSYIINVILKQNYEFINLVGTDQLKIVHSIKDNRKQKIVLRLREAWIFVCHHDLQYQENPDF